MKLERYRRPDGSLGLKPKTLAPTPDEQRELAAIQQRFKQTMADPSLSEEGRINRARAFAQGFNVDAVTRSLAQQVAAVANANDAIRAHRAEIEAIKNDLGSLVMGRADGHRGRALDRIEQLEQKIARAQIDTMNAVSGNHDTAIEEFLNERRAAAAQQEKADAMAAAIDDARAAVAAESLATRAREIAEAEAKHGGVSDV